MMNLTNISVEESFALLKQQKRYTTFVEEKRIFALPALESTGCRLVIGDPSFTLTVPVSEVSINYHNGNVKPIEAMKCVGSIVYFTLIEKDGKIVPSHYEVQKMVFDEIMSKPLGTVLTGRIWSHSHMGDFVDIGAGVLALLPLCLMTVARTLPDQVRFDVGEEVKCILHSKDNNRFVVNTMPMFGTYAENAEYFQTNGTYVGVVSSTMDDGTFVELAPNFVGLTSSPIEDARIGDSVVVCVRHINPERGKVKLDFVNYSETAAPLWSYTGNVHKQERITHWDYNPLGPKPKSFTYEDENNES